MLGAIIGDIVGSRFEFDPTNDYNFELFTEDCGYTDDSICTFAIADALMKGEDFGISLHQWCRQYPHPMGSYGGRFAQWVRSDNPQPYGSFGNGSAMRVSPVAWFCKQREQVLACAKMTAACTHNHPEGIKGAQTVALAIYIAKQQRILKASAKETIKTVIKKCIDFSGYNIDIRKEDVINRFDETCQGTVPVALWIISQSKGFEEAIRKAVSLGADADTLGAIVGSIAEAIWGIPEEIKAKALSYLDERMLKLLQDWKRSEQVKTLDITAFTEKYINYFLTEYDPETSSFYKLFDSPTFPSECWNLGFEMDCGHSFIEAYGEDAWRSNERLLKIVDSIDDLKILGSALFSQWRYWNHWAFGHPSNDDKEWFLTILRRMQKLVQ